MYETSENPSEQADACPPPLQGEACPYGIKYTRLRVVEGSATLKMQVQIRNKKCKPQKRKGAGGVHRGGAFCARERSAQPRPYVASLGTFLAKQESTAAGRHDKVTIFAGLHIKAIQSKFFHLLHKPDSTVPSVRR